MSAAQPDLFGGASIDYPTRRKTDPDRWYLGVRQHTSSTDQRCVIASVLPGNVACSCSATLIRMPGVPWPQRARKAALLLAALNSLPIDYAAHTAVGAINLAYFHLQQLPIPRPEQIEPYAQLLIPRVARLTCTSWDMRTWGEDLGLQPYSPCGWDEQSRFALMGEIDAIMAGVMGLDRDDIEHMLADFPALRRAETKRYGEYLTAACMLDAWRRLEDLMGGVPGMIRQS